MFQRTLVAAAIVVVASDAAFYAQAEKVDFVRDVQPILRQNCYGCHGPQQHMNNFRLDRRSDAMRGGTIAVIGPGNSEGSRMYQRLIGPDFGPQMPPTGKLQPEQIATIKAWIDQGAEWPDSAAGEVPAVPPDPRATRIINALRDGDANAFRSAVAGDAGAAKLKGVGGSTPLMFAALYGNAAQVEVLLDNGADPNARNDAGATPLMWAVGDLEKTRLLIDHGADVNAASDDRRTALMIAAGLPGATPVVNLLLDHGADVNAKAPGILGDTTALVEAAYSGDAGAFKLLAARSADVNVGGGGALGLALRAGCLDCVETLLKTVNRAVFTPNMLFGGPPLGPGLATPLMLEHGADVTARDPSGRTVLMIAAASDVMTPEIVQLLIARGVDVNATNAMGETALGHARLRGNTPIVDLLLKAGAKEPAAPASPGTPSPAASVRAALDRSLPMLQRNDENFLRKAGCVSCHNNSLTAMAVAAARKAGVPVNEQVARQQATAIGNYLEGWRDRALQGNGIPGDADTVSYILIGLAAENYSADLSTDAMAHFLKRQQTSSGQWRILAHRPPLESSDIEVTALSMRALQRYAPKAQRAEYDRAVQRAAAWLAQAPATSLEDRAFQLLGLGWARVDKARIAKARQGLVALQRADGGWSQLSTLPSDAYATGEALVALVESGAMTATDPVYKRGVQFLLNTQFADGSWFVKSRAIPLQPHFESGFPFGKDQFISAAGSNWAAMALALGYRKPS
jgi:ankyrin repeat protein